MGKTILIDGQLYSVASDDTYLSQMGDDFKPHMVTLFKRLISKTDNVLDIGANIDLTSILFSSFANKVVCFEANPSTFQILMNNI